MLKSQERADKMAQRGKALAINSDDLSLIPRTHTGERRKPAPEDCPLVLTGMPWKPVPPLLIPHVK